MRSEGACTNVPVRLVSWDVDGTLYSRARFLSNVSYSLAKAIASGVGSSALRDLRALILERRRVEAIRGLAPGKEANASRRAARLELERRWWIPALRRIGPVPIVTQAIQQLRQRSIAQVVFSDYLAGEKLEALGLSGSFDAVLTGEELGAFKPSPRGLLVMARQFDVSPAEILHIGDRVDTDGEASRAAGCQFLKLGWPSCSGRSLAARLQALRFAEDSIKSLRE